MIVESRRIFGTTVYANFDGTVTDSEGVLQRTRKKDGGHIQVLINKKWLSLAKVIIEAFMKPSKKLIVHIDGNKANNAVYNLMYSNPMAIQFPAVYQAYKGLSVDIMKGVLAMVDNEEDIGSICKKFRLDERVVMFVIKRRVENNL